MSFLCEYISFFRILSNLQYRRAMRQLAILLLRSFAFLTLPNKAAINDLEQASVSPVWEFLLGGEKKWNRCIVRYVHSGLSQISLPPPLHNTPLICTPASIQPGRLQRFISQTPPHQIYRLSQTSPFSASEACTLLTSSSPWKFSPSFGIQENPHLWFCHYTLQLLVTDSSLCQAGPSLATMLPRGELPKRNGTGY